MSRVAGADSSGLSAGGPMAETQDIVELDLRIRLTERARNHLVERASRIGRALNDYAWELVESAVTAPIAGATESASNPSVVEFDRALDDFFAANPEKLPAMPSNFYRDDIYADHD